MKTKGIDKLFYVDNLEEQVILGVVEKTLVPLARY